MKKRLCLLTACLLAVPALGQSAASPRLPLTPAIKATINAQALKYGQVHCAQDYSFYFEAASKSTPAEIKAVYEDSVHRLKAEPNLKVKSFYSPDLFWIVATLGTRATYLTSVKDGATIRNYICSSR